MSTLSRTMGLRERLQEVYLQKSTLVLGSLWDDTFAVAQVNQTCRCVFPVSYVSCSWKLEIDIAVAVIGFHVGFVRNFLIQQYDAVGRLSRATFTCCDSFLSVCFSWLYTLFCFLYEHFSFTSSEWHSIICGNHCGLNHPGRFCELPGAICRDRLRLSLWNLRTFPYWL